jgi:hypothetical protein
MSILNTPLSEAGAKGQGALVPEGTYTDCKITSLEEMELSEDMVADGLKGRIKVVFENADRTLTGFVNVKDAANPHPKSALFGLMSALYPDVGEREGMALSDTVGGKVNILVVHDTAGNGKTYAQFNYRTCK